MTPGDSTKVTLILCVDPLLEPGNGPNWFPFDPDILYEIKVDNNNDAVEDIVFQFRFTTEQRLPNLFQVYAGAGSGINAPANSPAPVPPGTLDRAAADHVVHFAGSRPASELHRDDGEGRRGDAADERRAALRRAQQRRTANDGL